MGGSSQTQRTHQTTNQNQTATTTAPGTDYGTALLPHGTDLANQVMGQTAFSGDRVAAPISQDQYVAQWGNAPSTFVPQRTATDNPFQVAQTHVDTNAQEGIDAGLAAANSNQAALNPLVAQGYNQWANILSGGQNPYLDQILTQLQTRHNEAAANSNNQIAYTAGAAGAFGGTDMGRQQTWTAGQQQQALDETTANLLYGDYLNNQQMLLQAPQALAGWAGVSTIPAEQFAHYGGMRQQNLQEAAATGDENAQRLQNNLHQAMTLNDQNAVLAAQEAISQWEAAHTISEAQVANTTAGNAVTQQQNQAGLDNNYLNWLAQQENLNNQISNMGQIISWGGAVPGGTSTSSGTSTTDGTTTTSQQNSPWQIAAGLGGAALQAFSPGGMFSGGLSALGGLFGGNNSQIAPVPTLNPLQPITAPTLNPGFAYSDRSLKKDIIPLGRDARGIQWHSFRYLWDSKAELRRGVMADEIPQEFVAHDENGWAMVNYPALAAWGG